MGTRADFYVGKGKKAEWIGSIAWDGYKDGIAKSVLKATTAASFRKAVTKFFNGRDDVSLPKDGWPWPWDDSNTTDCSYWFFDGKVWEDFDDCYRDVNEKQTQIQYPDMSKKKKVAKGKRSGLIVIGAS